MHALTLRGHIVTALLAALFLIPAMPGTSFATTLTVSVASADESGPASANSENLSEVDCNKLVSGGGVRVYVSQGSIPNGLKVNGTVPSTNGTAQSSDGDNDVEYWIGIGGGGGSAPGSDARTTGFGMCIDSGPDSTRVEVASTAGPTTSGTIATATATCDTGERLLGGGARTTPASIGSLKPIGSFPSDSGGNPVTSGTNPSSWTAVGLNGGGGDSSNTTYAFAICSNSASNPAVTVVNQQVAGPTSASSGVSVTATCGENTTLLSGGAFASKDFGAPESQGVHLAGSFPSTSGGSPVTSGNASSWTAEARTGGVSSPNTETDVWALCGSSSY